MTTDLALTPGASAAAASVAIRAEVRSIVVTGPDIQQLLDAVSVDIEVVPTMDIDSADMAQELKTSMGRLATVSSVVEAERLERGEPLRNALKWLQDGYGPVKSKLDGIVAAGKVKLEAWNASERERIRKEQEAAQEAARKAAAEAAEAEAAALAAAQATAVAAQAAAAAGSEQVAAAMESQAMAAVDQARKTAAQATAVAFARPVSTGVAPKAAGVIWKAECIDKAALLQHIGERIAAGDKSLIGLVEIDPKAINTLAKLQEANLRVPGLRPFTEARATRVTKVAIAA